MVVRIMCEEGTRLADLHELKLFGKFRECSKEEEERIYVRPDSESGCR